MMASSSRMLCSSSTTSTRMSDIGRRQGDGEGAAHARAAVHVDVAAVVLHDAVYEREPEAAAAGLRREERLEDVAQVAGGDALTGVGHAQDQAAAGDCHRHLELAAVGHRLHGVEAEIPDDLPELLAIHAPR